VRQIIAALLASLSSLALAACAPVIPAPAQARPTVARAAEAAAPGHTWIVADGAAIVAALPALPEPLPVAPNAPADPTGLDAWAEPASAWMTEALHAIVADSTRPAHAARALMLLSVALADGLAVGEQARAAGAAVSDDALLAEAAGRLLAYTHPARGAAAATLAEGAAWAGLWRGAATVGGVLNGRQIGAAVADRVIAWGARDGSLDMKLDVGLPAAGPGVWAPTGPALDRPELPGWGSVRTVAIGEAASLRAPAPPPWESPKMRATYAAFVQAQRGLSQADEALARRWAGGPGTVTPPGIWVEIGRDLIARHRLATPAAARVYAALGVALHDSAVACWESKFTYWLVRPQQAMVATNPAWQPLLKTPPHPAYPSGHATFSGAASALLGALFPADAAQLDQWAEEAARSRVLGGIHWPIDGAAGLAQGRAVAERVLARLGQ
jgi:hypothetical protein